MKLYARIVMTVALIVGLALHCGPVGDAANACVAPESTGEASRDFDLTSSAVRYDPALDLLIFEQSVTGVAGGTIPEPAGKLNGAPVQGYVFPTSLKSVDVGFDERDGIVALAVTSHPDFDDTPLWDEDNDGDYGNDGPIFHSHWVLLQKDQRVAGGFSVQPTDDATVLPATNPGMPMYMDSPGFSIVKQGSRIRVLVPAQRVNHQTDFRYDGLTAFLRVSIGDAEKPMLGVYDVYRVCSGDLSLPYSVRR